MFLTAMRGLGGPFMTPKIVHGLGTEQALHLGPVTGSQLAGRE